jgi:type IV pilus assembly protein PilY1
MGDPLHVKPVALNYGSSGNPQTTVFVTTNDGLLHSIDAADASGIENWAYLPSRLLARQKELMLNPPAAAKRYGLDGEIRLFVANDDRQPGISGTEQPILVFGMGRGGDAVFAVNVKNLMAPTLQWQIDHTTETGRSPSPFLRLGQVWAAPEIALIDVAGTEHRAVVLSGGYDDSVDNRGHRPDANVGDAGNAIFIVDLLDGELLWSAGKPGQGHDTDDTQPPSDLEEMLYSIPAAPRVLDLTGDGKADRLYVGDTGGQVWRFDILNGNDRDHLGVGHRLASLGASSPASEVRRFYATPDVVLVDCIREGFLAVNIGSGYRGHPLDTDVEDQFFSIRDPNVFGPIQTATSPIEVGDLLDITDDPDAVMPPDAAGWRIRMTQDPGEKILTGAVTFNNTIFFTSFSPVDRVSACAGGIGVNRAYQVGACNGRAVTNLDGSTEPGPLDVEDRFRTLPQTGIAPAAALLMPADATESVVACVGLICFDVAGRVLQQTYWSQEPSR